MPFALLDDKLHSHPKRHIAGLDGVGLWALALSYCSDQLTDGWVPEGWAYELAKPATIKRTTASALWIRVEGGETFAYVTDEGPYTVTIPGPGYFIPDFLVLNPCRDDVLRKRSELSEKRAAAGRKGAAARWRHHVPDHDDTKQRVRSRANTAQKAGRIETEPCADCGAIYALKHHEDYSKPEDVTWLCRRCHSKRHSNNNGKTLATACQDDGPQPLPHKEPAAEPLDQEKQTELERIIGSLKGVDEGTFSVLAPIASRLPMSVLADVRERCGGKGPGWVVNALRAELEERVA